MPTKINYGIENLQTLEVTGGCTECSVGCQNCWARKEVWRMAHNPLLGDKWKGLVKKTSEGLRWTGKIKLFEDALNIPIKRGKPTTYFVDSKADLFHKDVPFEFQVKVLNSIYKCQQHQFLFLTKRVDNMLTFFNCFYDDPSYDNSLQNFRHVHLGATICTQKEADEILPIALQIPGFDWISAEPLLGEIDFTNLNPSPKTTLNALDGWQRNYVTRAKRELRNASKYTNGIKRIVVGCESGPKRRPCKLEHIRLIVEQCAAAGVGCYVKQIPMPWCGKEYRGQWDSMPTIEELDEMNKMKNYVSHNPAEWPEDLRVRDEL